ncbi:MAG: hypothetical protein M0004_09175 [Actinomycetota bacterium]|nr:hypothetical protein [Actinomycetota bacterium]
MGTDVANGSPIPDGHPGLGAPSVRSSRLARRRKPIAVAIVALTALTTGSLFFLGTTGTSSLSITPPAGVPSSGGIASVTDMSATMSAGTGAAQKQDDLVIAAVTTAASEANAIKVSISWLDPNDAGKVLNNPNAQISVGLYAPVATGSCSGSTATTPSGAPETISFTATNNMPYCGQLQPATGSSSVSSDPTTGAAALFLSTSLLSGYLLPSTDLSGSEVACSAAVSTTPCLISSQAGSQRIFFVGLSILTPGHSPTGQQSQLGTLSFFVRASAA